MKKTILILMIGMFLISLASANIATLGDFKQGECILLKQTCASCSYVNFTRVSYPDGTRAMNNTQSIKDGSVYELEFCNTDQLGRYIVEGIGDVDGIDTVFAYDFKVSGGNITLILLLGLFALSLLGLSYMLENEYISFISGCLFLVLGIYTMIYGITALSDIYTRTIAFVSLGLGIILTIASAYGLVEKFD
jgi:hypothetical protein